MAILSQPTRLLFNAATITTVATYTYMHDKDTTVSEWISIKYDNVVLQCCTATLTASSMDVRIEGRFPASNRAAEIYNYTVTAAESIDRLINITERVKEIRVGAKVGNASTPNVFYSSVIFSEKNR